MTSPFRKSSLLVLITTVLIVVSLTWAAWDMNFWPSDEKAYYFDAAVALKNFQHLSQIHQNIDAEKVRWLHGKEIFILGVSFFQRLLHDERTIRPFLLLGVLAVAGSSLLIYALAGRFWGNRAALVCYAAFTFALWPYTYVLFAKHQTLGLLLFLLAVFLLPDASRNKWTGWRLYGSGLSWGLSLFSSTVTPLYAPLYAAAFLYQSRIFHSFDWRNLWRAVVMPAGLICCGALSIFIWVNFPDVIRNLKSYWEYVHISGAYNHFFYNQPHLQQWFLDQPVAAVRGGWVWIGKYFWVIMPVLWPVYGLSILALGWLCLTKKIRLWPAAGMVMLSVSPPLLAELAHVAQYGANYFPSLIGVVLLLGYGVSRSERISLNPSQRKILNGLLVLTAAAHVGVNAYIFSTDVFPCRLATTFLSREIEKRGIQQLHTYPLHPHREYFTEYLNPSVLQKLRFLPMNYISVPREGYILLPPVSGDSIYVAAISSYADYDGDIFLNELRRKDKLADYAIASFPTLINSRIWVHEEEILTYRDLMLRHDLAKHNKTSGRVWLLDAAKLQADLKENLPLPDEVNLVQNDIRNIGTARKVYMYKGHPGRIAAPTTLHQIGMRLYKVGQPADALRLYVYKLDDKQPVWVPLGNSFSSRPLPSETLTDNPASSFAVFEFAPAQELPPGRYYFVVYRTGTPDDRNFYRVFKDDLHIR